LNDHNPLLNHSILSISPLNNTNPGCETRSKPERHLHLLQEQATLAAATLHNAASMLALLFPQKTGLQNALNNAALVVAEAAILIQQENK
jgi:hypothetical protein